MTLLRINQTGTASSRAKPALLAAFLGSLALALVIAFTHASSARALQDSETFYTVYGNAYTAVTKELQAVYRASGGEVAYCGDMSLPGPGADGRVYDSGWTYCTGPLAYAMYHGYPRTTAICGHELSADQAQAVTQYVIWVLNGDLTQNFTFNYNSEVLPVIADVWTQPMRDAARGLLDAALHDASPADAPQNHFARVYSNGGANVQSMVVAPREGTLRLVKTSANPAATDGNALYSLEEAHYGVYTDKACKNVVAELITKSNGTATATLEAGTYYIKELKAPAGYEASSTVHSVTVTMGDVAELKVKEKPFVTTSFPIFKYDAATGPSASSQGAASLLGAEFTVSFYAGHYDTTEALPQKPDRTWTIRTIKEDDYAVAYLSDACKVSGDDWFALAEDDSALLPLGTVLVQETKAPSGYEASPASYIAQIQSDGQQAQLVPIGSWPTADRDMAVQHALAIENQAIRSDIRFVKRDADTQEPMPGVAFLITSKTTGEAHVIVTDDEGAFDSSAYRTGAINANDPTMPNANGATELAEDGAWLVADDSKLDSKAGVWFSGLDPSSVSWEKDATSYRVGDTVIKVREDLGALPYDDYVITELPCAANRGHKLVEFSVSLTAATGEQGSSPIDLGPIDNETIGIRTILTYDEGLKVAAAAEDVTLTDTIEYHNLDEGVEYALLGVLYALEDDGSLGAELARGETSFTTSGSYGSEQVTFSVDTSELAGKRVVAFEYLKDARGIVRAEHCEPEDRDQQISVPSISTSISDKTGPEVLSTAQDAKIVDIVTYHGLETGKTYIVEGTLHQAEEKDGERNDLGPLCDARGDEVKGTATFVADESSGEVEVTFTFDASALDLQGKTLVAFEDLKLDTILLATHADINDAAQSVTVVTPRKPWKGIPQTGALLPLSVVGSLGIATGVVGFLVARRKRHI